jgi:hypothetical protein
LKQERLQAAAKLLRLWRPISGANGGCESCVSVSHLVDIWIDQFHHACGVRKVLETELTVKTVCVFCGQQEASQSLQFFVGLDDLKQPLGKPFATMGLQDINVGQVGKGGLVGDDATETDLMVTVKNTKADGIRNCSFNGGHWYARRPVTAGQEGMDGDNVKAMPVRRNCVLAAVCDVVHFEIYLSLDSATVQGVHWN